MEEIASALEDAGYSTYLPHRDGVEAFVLNSVNNPLANMPVFRPVIRFLGRATFALDIFKVLDCDYFVFNANGGVPDEGGVVETGVAFAAGKPVVVFRSDARAEQGRCADLLLMGASGTFEAVSRASDIPDALESIGERLRSPGRSGPDPGGATPSARAASCVDNAPPFVRRMAGFGRRVDRVLGAISFLKPKNMMSR